MFNSTGWIYAYLLTYLLKQNYVESIVCPSHGIPAMAIGLMTEVTIRSEHAKFTMKILPTVLGFREPTEPLSEPMTRRLPNVPTTDAKLMTLMYGSVRAAGALDSSDVLLPFSDTTRSIVRMYCKRKQRQ